MIRRLTLHEHLQPHAPKRILALDGGGTRGVLTLAYLRRLQALLRERHRDERLRLCDYFDLIAGTSTGAILAAGLALGKDAETLLALYRRLGPKVFGASRSGILLPRFGSRFLERVLREEYGDLLLGSKDLLTGLLIVVKRIDTGSVWLLTNHPNSQYATALPGKKRIANLELPLCRIVRASTAAPHYFASERLEIARVTQGTTTSRISGEFVDGGVSPANNPALQALKVATLSGYRFGWPAGEDRLLLVSVGTGRHPASHELIPSLFKAPAIGHAFRSLLSVTADCEDETELIMQWLSNSPTRRSIDGAVGDLAGDLLGGRPLLSYLRYNVVFERDWFNEHLGMEVTTWRLGELASMAAPANMDELWEIGCLAAARQLHAGDLPAEFDLPSD